MLVPTKILVPTDFSEYSEKALGQAVDIAKRYAAKVFLLHVIHEEVRRTGFDFTLPEATAREIKDATYVWAKEKLQEQIGLYAKTEEVEINPVIREGIP